MALRPLARLIFYSCYLCLLLHTLLTKKKTYKLSFGPLPPQEHGQRATAAYVQPRKAAHGKTDESSKLRLHRPGVSILSLLLRLLVSRTVYLISFFLSLPPPVVEPASAYTCACAQQLVAPLSCLSGWSSFLYAHHGCHGHPSHTISRINWKVSSEESEHETGESGIDRC